MCNELKELIIKSLEEKKAFDIKVIDVSQQTSIAKYFIIASGSSTRNISAIIDHVTLTIKKNSNHNTMIDGASDSNWVVLDVQNIIVHVFSPEMRIYYDLESLYDRELH